MAGDDSMASSQPLSGETPQRRLCNVSFSIRRPNEYTTWRPRMERIDWFGMVGWGPFLFSWQMEKVPGQDLNLDDGEKADAAENGCFDEVEG